MNRATVIKFAVSAALLGTVAVGCKPDSHPATLSSVAPRADRQAAKLADQVNVALTAHDGAAAVRSAEAAVVLMPRDASYRVLLGRAYIAAGRFKSAEAVLTDALVLKPGDGQAELSLALTRIALGKWDEARDLLASARGKVGESDRGLALALAGDRAGGLTVLEGAARAPGADAKARQNLALGYALSGRWAESASIAAQDLSPDQVKARMTEWAQMSQPRDAWDQVAALMHVTPIEDGGMPTALALAPVQPQAEPVAVAAAEPAAPVGAPTGAPVAELAEASVPASVPAPIAEVAQVATPVAPAVAVAPSAAMPAPYLVETAAATPPPLIAAPKAAGRLLLARATPKPLRQSTGGRYVVQLGAFSSAEKVEGAWRRTANRVGRIAALAPSSAAFGKQGAGTVYRLSLAGFETRAAAVSLCQHIRAAKGECFVRVAAGDALAQWAKPGIRLAMR